MENITVYPSAAEILASSCGPSITLNSSACTIHNPWEQLIDDKLKEYCHSTDMHLDDLEEDIEFLDKMRKDMNNEIAYHADMVNQFISDISLLVDENARLRGELNDLRDQIYVLQQRLDNQ